MTIDGQRQDLTGLIDHTLLRATATLAEINTLCAEALQHRFASVCVNPCMVPAAADRVRGSGVKVCTVLGFPLGATTSETKTAECSDAVRNGAEELDMVLNLGFLKSGKLDFVASDISAVVKAARGRLVKVILETCYLTDAEKTTACRLAIDAGAHFVKTSTGFGPSGATVEDIRLMRSAVGPRPGVKASGGIRTLDDARRMVAAGATRLGTSAGVSIVQGLAAAGQSPVY